MERPERVYRWIADAGISAPEVLLVPLRTKDGVSSARYGSSLARGKNSITVHARLMSELAGFAGRALRMILADDGLKKALDEQQTLARKMSHRVKICSASSKA